MTEQPDTDHFTYVTAAEYSRLQAALDVPGVPNGRIRREVERMRAEAGVSGLLHRSDPTPERDGYTIGVYLPPGAPWATVEALTDQIMGLAATVGDGQRWDVHVTGQAGDPMRICHEPDADFRRWPDVRPGVVTSEERVAEHRAAMEAEIAEQRCNEDRAHEQAMHKRKRGGDEG